MTSQRMPAPPFTVFYSYADEDKKLLALLEKHLGSLRNQEIIQDWHGEKVTGGEFRQSAIDHHLMTASVILLLISADYLASPYLHNNEMQRALERHRSRNALVIPILLRACDWQHEPFAQLRCFPGNRAPITSWSNQDEAFDDVVQGIRAAIKVLIGNTLPAPTADKRKEEQHNQDTWERYLRDLIKQLQGSRDMSGYVNLSGKTVSSSHAPGIWPKAFEDFHSLVYLELKGKLKREQNEVQWKHIDYERLASIDKAVEKFPCFVLVGEPGAGKTTTLRHLTIEAARKSIDGEKKAPKPLFLSLPGCDWKHVSSLEDFIRVNLPTGDDPKTLLAQGELALYLDGLNEMGSDGPEKAKLLRRWLHSSTQLPRIVLTCRIRDYIGDFDLDVPVVLIEEMNSQQIRQFATNYLGEVAEAFLQHIQFEEPSVQRAPHSLSQLARNPFLLSILIRVYEVSHVLPRNHGTLFRALIQYLWHLEGKKGTAGWIPFERMEQYFSHLAFAMIDEERPVDVPMEYALKHLHQDYSVLQAGHSAKILRINEQQTQVRFYHQLIQEYFAGVRLGKVGVGKKLEHRGFDDDWDLRPNFQKWGQAIIACCGMSKNADSILDQLLKKDVFLAAYCLDTGIEVSDTLRRKATEQLQAGLRTVLTSTTNPTLHAIKQRPFLHALSRTGEPLAADVLANYIVNERDPVLRDDAAHGLIEMESRFSLPALKKVLDTMTEEQPDSAYYAIISTLAVIRDVRVVPMLISLSGSKNASQRFHARYELLSLKQSPRPWKEGLHLALEDGDSFVREYAAKQLANL